MHIELLRADIKSLKVDAIVNPANPQMQHVGGLGRELVREGGRAMQEASAVPEPLQPGAAVVTTGGNLLCRFVIHTVVPRMGEGDEDAKLRAATWAALEKAEELAIAAVALPAMATGASGFSFERCARIMIGTTLDFRARARSLQRVVYCLFGKDPHDTFERVLKELES
ncbi:MAG TPA: macro domain-containing protein [Thermoanaerobaculia bacterium]|jgi:O-acetyl-ADP-ribose deacetylase (regulator of RNase III)